MKAAENGKYNRSKSSEFRFCPACRCSWIDELTHNRDIQPKYLEWLSHWSLAAGLYLQGLCV